MIVFEKFGQHQPLNRQAERYALEGAPIALSTMADAVGAVSTALDPLRRSVPPPRHSARAQRPAGAVEPIYEKCGLARTEASRTVVGVGFFNLGLGVHDKRTARYDSLMQWTASVQQGAQWPISHPNCDFGCLPGVAACEPSDVARRYELGFRTDGALALQDDNECVVVGGEILANRRALIESDFDHGDGHKILRRRCHLA